MSAEREPTIEAVSQRVLDRFGPHVAALLAYGSRIFGQARIGSAYDFWVIVRDGEAFHRANAEFYRTHLHEPSTPERQIALNRSGPLFYTYRDGGAEVKIAVIEERVFVRLCRYPWYTVKGRMQKPMLVMRSSPAVDAALLGARREGLLHGLSLTPAEFTMEELLRQICSLSYRAEIRPERKGAKIRSILRAGGARLDAMYRPLLAELPYVQARGDRFLDTRPAPERARARKATLRLLRRSKWSRRSRRFVLRNYHSHPHPIRYILLKILGEAQKPFARLLKRK
jgi:hypothetical protein